MKKGLFILIGVFVLSILSINFITADCLFDLECTDPNFPYCEPYTHQCVRCLYDAHCGETNSVCENFYCVPFPYTTSENDVSRPAGDEYAYMEYYAYFGQVFDSFVSYCCHNYGLGGDRLWTCIDHFTGGDYNYDLNPDRGIIYDFLGSHAQDEDSLADCLAIGMNNPMCLPYTDFSDGRHSHYYYCWDLFVPICEGCAFSYGQFDSCVVGPCSIGGSFMENQYVWYRDMDNDEHGDLFTPTSTTYNLPEFYLLLS